MRATSRFIAATLATLFPLALASAQTTTRVNVDSDGNEANDFSHSPDISADGNLVVFTSGASNLVPGDTNGEADVFLHDRRTGETRRISVSSEGDQGIGSSFGGSISADGSTVAFVSWASNLVTDDQNPERDIFVHDLVSGETELVSLSTAGDAANSRCLYPDLSADGRFVVFQSVATSLVPGDTNPNNEIFLRDRLDGITERISQNTAGDEADGFSASPTVSADGRFVAFESLSSNLPADGVANVQVIYLRDRLLGTTTRVSNDPDGTEPDGSCGLPQITADGNRVVFQSSATTLDSRSIGIEGVYLYDRLTDTVELVGLDSCGVAADVWTEFPTISPNGRYVGFSVLAFNWYNGLETGQQFYVRDLDRETTVVASQSSIGVPTSTLATDFSLSDLGDAAFTGWGDDLVPDDLNGEHDIFVHDTRTGLWVDASPQAPTLGDPLTLTAGGGGPGATGLLVASSVNGSPLGQPLAFFAYGPDGVFEVTATPNNAALTGLELGLTSYGFLCNGVLEQSEETILQFP